MKRHSCLDIQNRVQAIVVRAFQPEEWNLLCADVEFQALFAQVMTIEQAEAAMILGAHILETHQDELRRRHSF